MYLPSCMERGHEVSSTFNDPFLRSRIIINPGGGRERSKVKCIRINFNITIAVLLIRIF